MGDPFNRHGLEILVLKSKALSSSVLCVRELTSVLKAG